MADSDIQIPVTGTGDTGPKKVDTRTVGALTDEHRQVVVIGDPSTAAGVAGVDASNGLDVDVTRIGTGDNTVGRVKLTDGTDVADVLDLTNSNPLTVAVVNASGDQITSFGGSGGTSEVDDAAFTAATDSGTPIMGFVTSDTVDSGDVGVVAMTTARALNINIADSDLDVDHDSADSGQPVKVGAQARSSWPTAVANADRANAISDLFGRLLVAHIDPEMSVWKRANYTSTQTGAVIWDPSSGKKIAITSIVIGSYGTTSARLILWFGANGDTAYDDGTDQLVLAASFAPSSTAKPGLVFTPPHPIFCKTADYELHCTTDAGMSVDIAVYGYEY